MKNIRHLILSRVALFLSLILTVIFIVIVISDNPTESIVSLLIDPLIGSQSRWHIFERSIPIMFTGMAFCFILSVNEFNLAVEGIFYLGGFLGALVGIYTSFPKGIHFFVALTVSAISGIIIMYILSFLENRFSLSIMVLSLMTNYLLLYIVLHFLTNIVRDSSYPYTATYEIKNSARLPFIQYSTSIALIMGIIISIIGAFVLFKTNFGYKVRLVGANRVYARFLGINVGAILMISQIVGGILSAVGGCSEILGCYERFRWTQLSGYGWTGMTIAIIGRNNPGLVPIIAIAFSYLEVGCEYMLINTNVQPEIFDIIEFIFLLSFSSKYLLERKRLGEKKLRVKYNG